MYIILLPVFLWFSYKARTVYNVGRNDLEHYAGGSITAKNTILIVLTIDKFLQVVTFDT